MFRLRNLQMHSRIRRWFWEVGWEPSDFQKECWQHIKYGRSGLLAASTGSGKTYALWLGFVNRWLTEAPETFQSRQTRLLWITPLRALGQEIQKALERPLREMGLSGSVALWTGDTPVSEKRALLNTAPLALVTTPESLHVMLTRKGYPAFFSGLEAIVVDEWHELMGTKRGVMTELAVHWLRHTCAPQCQLWGISATFGDFETAAEALFGKRASEAVFVQGPRHKTIRIHSVIPDNIDDLPQSGHIGVKLLEKTLPIILQEGSTLIFTNTRSQSEIWYQRYLEVCPDLAGRLALHHGSLDGELRHWVENRLKDGRLKAVVCTSSLDLGVDFLPVERVIQVGSPKSVARFIQRAGRSGHAPGRESQIWFVPTHSMELMEAAALRQAIKEGILEPPHPPYPCWDVLMQFMTTLAVSEGFYAEQLFSILRQSLSFCNLEDNDFKQLLRFSAMGGTALSAYPDFRRMEKEEDGLWRVKDRRVALRHRLNIGVIPSDSMMWVKLKSGKRLGQIEEWFLSRLNPGDIFWFAGQPLKLIKVKDMEALVEKAQAQEALIPSWMGGRLPLSSSLASLILRMFENAAQNRYITPELESLRPLLKVQADLSVIPRPGIIAVEQFSTRLGYHTLIYPFEGRVAHEAIGSLLAYRLGRLLPLRVSVAMNDYGLELSTDRPLDLPGLHKLGLFRTQGLYDDLLQSVNAVELARRRFRDIARIAGLVFTGYPGREKKNRHLQASASLIFDVLSEHDKQNLLLRQALDEALNGIEQHRIYAFFHKMSTGKVEYRKTESPTPLSIPIITDRLRNSYSSLKFEDEIQNILNEKHDA